MSKKSWRNRGQVIATQPRKFNWKPHKIFNTYELASEEKNRLLESGSKHIKIRRCGPDGTKFKVKIGHPVKIKKEAKTSDKNETNNKKEKSDD